MNAEFVCMLVLASAVCGLIGAAVGSQKGNAASGFWWGFFLWQIGWILVALASDTRRKCPLCQGVIARAAAVNCQHCGGRLKRKAYVGRGGDPVEEWEARQGRQ